MENLQNQKAEFHFHGFESKAENDRIFLSSKFIIDILENCISDEWGKSTSFAQIIFNKSSLPKFISCLENYLRKNSLDTYIFKTDDDEFEIRFFENGFHQNMIEILQVDFERENSYLSTILCDALEIPMKYAFLTNYEFLPILISALKKIK